MVNPQTEREVRRALAERMKALRRSRNWTQLALAERSGLPRTYVADMEGERRNPSLRNLVRVANALGVRVGELFGGEE